MTCPASPPWWPGPVRISGRSSSWFRSAAGRRLGRSQRPHMRTYAFSCTTRRHTASSSGRSRRRSSAASSGRAVPAPRHQTARCTAGCQLVSPIYSARGLGAPAPHTAPTRDGKGIVFGALRAPIRRVAPVAVRRAYTPFADAPLAISPPRTISWPGGPATTTSRLMGSARCQGSRPDSAAGRPRGTAAACGGGSAFLEMTAPLPWRAADQAVTTTTSKASAAATVRLRRTRTGTGRLPDGRRRSALATSRWPNSARRFSMHPATLSFVAEPETARWLPLTGARSPRPRAYLSEPDPPPG